MAILSGQGAFKMYGRCMHMAVMRYSAVQNMDTGQQTLREEDR